MPERNRKDADWPTARHIPIDDADFYFDTRTTSYSTAGPGGVLKRALTA